MEVVVSRGELEDARKHGLLEDGPELKVWDKLVSLIDGRSSTELVRLSQCGCDCPLEDPSTLAGIREEDGELYLDVNINVLIEIETFPRLSKKADVIRSLVDKMVVVKRKRQD